MTQHEIIGEENNWSIKRYFFPFTTGKAIHFFIIIGLLLYANSLFNGFVWDDFPFILQNPEINTINLFAAFGNNYFNNSGYYRPLPEIYFSLVYGLFGQNAFFYHLVQLLLHISCTCVLFLFFNKFFRLSLAFFLSLIFLVHPINVESVSYIAATQSELFFLPGMIALFLSTKKDITQKRFILIFCLLTIALFTKETGSIFLLAAILYRMLFIKKEIKKFLIGGAIIISFYAFMRFLIGGVYLSKISYAPIAQLSWETRFYNMPSIIAYYVKTFFFPLNLAIDQQWVVTSPTFLHFYLPLGVISSLVVVLFFFGKYLQQKSQHAFSNLLFFGLLFISSIFLLLQIFPLDMTVADRWFYFPLVGLLGITGIIISQIPKQYFKKILPVVGIIVILLLSTRTIVRNTNWHDLLTLYSHDISIEDNFDNEHNYAVVLVQNGRVEESIQHFLKADALNSTEFTLRDTGLAYLALDKKEKSFHYLSQALTTKSPVLLPHHHQTATYEALARYYLIYKDYKNAERVLDTGINDYPLAYTLWYFKAINASFLHDNNQALFAAHKAYTLYPSQETLAVYSTLSQNRPLNMKVSNR